MFLQTKEGLVINAASIAQIARHPAADASLSNSHFRVVITLHDGSEVNGHLRKDDSFAWWFNDAEAQLLPETQCRMLLTYQTDVEVPLPEREPILAWAVSEGAAGLAGPVPITIRGPVRDGYVSHPDGCVSQIGEAATWSSEDAWLREMREAHSQAQDWREVYPEEADYGQG